MAKRSFFYKAKPPKERVSDRQGFASRRRASELVEWVLLKERPIDEAPESGQPLPDQDRALARQIALTVLRHYFWLERLLSQRLEKGLPSGLPHLHSALLIGAAQILFLDVPDHSAVDLAVSLVEHDRKAVGLKGLANAVLRGIVRDKAEILASFDPLDNLNPWMKASWCHSYGEEPARAIARACMVEPPLDITVKSDPSQWAERLGGTMTPTGSVRLVPDRPVPMMDGYGEGAWWVQDAAAALPARLFGDVRGKHMADFCAAPGGKTAQLAVMGATVTAFDRSERRLERLHENMERLGLDVDVHVQDALLVDGSYDAILLDAPCSATGTLRGHPDVGLLKTPQDVRQLVQLQAKLLDRAAQCVKAGGMIIYCTCSLERAEGEDQIAAFVSRHGNFALSPMTEDICDGLEGLVSVEGYLRSLPAHWPHSVPRLAGLDGFFAARLVRKS